MFNRKNHMITHRMSFNNHIKVIQPVFIVLLIYILITVFVSYTDDLKSEMVVFFVIAFSLFTLLPVLILHLEYYFKNKGVILKINYSNKTMEYIKGVESLKTTFSEIEKIELIQSPSYMKGEIQWSPTDRYHYSRILTKDGAELIITCLMTPDFDLGLTDKVFKRKRIFTSIFLESI